jgi:hypothetical protein
MKLADKRHWIALFAAIFLSSKLAMAVELCVHDMSRAEHVAAEAAHGGHFDPASAEADPCCEQIQQAIDPADCCPAIVPARRGGVQECHTGGASSADGVPVPYAFLPRVSWKPAPPAAEPLYRVVGPPFSIVFKNFRS